ncbi:MAG: DUF2235 domain-containing protein [Actinobacteria bacterium]|nr:DUF2235 domain-containing protein [Actinomycetota bacterium]
MKRIVICCDGTWNRPENQNVTNIEKIARTIETDAARTGGVQQLVHYVNGVGTSWYWVDRLLGGAFGLGLFGNVTDAYRFLALNYSPGRPGEPGDEIYVLGFSRGAYTARSLVGMIGRVGLLTSESLIANKLPEAVDRYRRARPASGDFGSSEEEFKRDHCHNPKIRFVGVFDTVGALGVPGAVFNRHKFHDVRLSPAVSCARQALAIDERRMKFEPSLWEDDGGGTQNDRIKQVWFEGAHSDVGGGYSDTGLSDTSLLWMVREANAQGLTFNEGLLDSYIGCGSSAVRHNSMNGGYRFLNAIARLKSIVRPNPRFRSGRRVLDPAGAIYPKVASSAAEHWASDDTRYKPANIGWYAETRTEDQFKAATEKVVALPDKSIAVLHSRLQEAGVDLGESPTARAVSPVAQARQGETSVDRPTGAN